MPYFYGYGRVSTDKQAVSPETQQSLIFKEFKHRLEVGTLPKGTEWGGFTADTDVSRAVKFLHRPAGAILALKLTAGDYLCVSAYDRLIGSLVDGHETLTWARDEKINLIIIGLGIDTSTPVGKFFFDIMGSVKEFEREEISRRTREGLRYRRESGRPVGNTPIGYLIKTIIPAGGRPMKYYFPCQRQRRYGEAIVALKDQHGMSFENIALRFNHAKIPNPRSRTGELNTDRCTIGNYYRAVKKGWPLHGGLQWKKPEFEYKIAPNNTIDLRRASA